MTKYYSNQPDFTGDPSSPLISPNSYFKTMSDLMDDIEAAGKTVQDEGVEDLYIQKGEASLGTTKDSSVFDKSMKRIYSMLTSAKKIHSDIMQNIDSKFTKGMESAFTSLNNVNGEGNPYKSKYTTKTETRRVSRGYTTGYGQIYENVTEEKPYSLAEILDGKASPIQAAKDVYNDRLAAVKELLAKKDQLSDEQIKALEGKSAEDIVAARYPGQLPDYQKLKASRYYEENKATLQRVDTGLKALAILAMIGGTLLAPATGGASLYATYAGGAYLAGDSAYSSVTGHTMITGTQLSTEERVWAGIDAAVTMFSMGSAAYLGKLAKTGTSGSTLLKGVATAGKYADDVNDVSKVVYAAATGKDPNSALQNLVLGQVMGFGVGKAGNYLGGKFGRSGVPDLAADLPSSGKQAGNLDVSLQAKRLPKLDMDSVHLSSRKDLHLKASTADMTLAKLKSHPAVSIDVPKVKGTANPSPSPTTTRVIIDQKLQEYGISWDEFNRLRNTRVTEMSQYEYDMMIDIRNSIPNPTEQTVLQKIIPVENADNYFGAKGWGVGGFISKRGDVVDIKTIEDAVNGLRLDYENSPFVETMIDANGNRVAVRDQNGNLKLKTDAFVRIEFRTHDTDYIDIPIGNRDGTKLDADPASGNGFIKSDEYLIPEYKIVNPDTKFTSVKLTDGSKMYLNVGGEEVLVGVVKNGKMYYVEG